MARIVYTLGELKGSVGGLTFQNNKSGHIVRQRPQVKKSSTFKQQRAHASHAGLLEQWQSLTSGQKDAWNTFATTYPKTNKFGEDKTLTGSNFFLSCNYMRLAISQSLLSDPPEHLLPGEPPTFNILLEQNKIEVERTGAINYTNDALIYWISLPTRRQTTSINQIRKWVAIVGSEPGNPYDLTDAWEEATGLVWNPTVNFPNSNIFVCVQTVRKASGITSALLCSKASTSDIFIYDEDYLAYVDEFTTPPTEERGLLLNQLFIDLKGAGIFAQLDRMWLLASEEEQQATVSLANPTSTKLENKNSCTWDVSGYTGDAISMYLDTHFSKASEAVKFLRDDNSWGAWCSAGPTGTRCFIGVSGNGGSTLILLRSGDTSLIEANQSDNDSYISQSRSSNVGLTTVERTSSSNANVYIDGTNSGSYSRNSFALIDYPVFLLALSSNGSPGSYSDAKICFAYFGSKSINQSTLYTLIFDYLTAIGAI
jgi:hypothetical protein